MTEISSPSMPRRLPPGCSEDRDRHGNVRIYYRPKGRPKVRLRGEPWTPGFMAAYEAAKGTEFKTSDRSRAALPAHGDGCACDTFPSAPITSASMHARSASVDKFWKERSTSLSRRTRSGFFKTFRSQR